MDLFILRHGKAAREPPPGGTDYDRPLTQRGRKDISETAAWMEGSGLSFDSIGTSPLVRARETAEIVAEHLSLVRVLGEWPELSPGGDEAALTGRIFRSGGVVLVVGHEPMLSSLVSALVSGGSARIVLSKGGLARIGDLRPPGHGELRWLLTRDQMRP
jgi:phosphohistidine phosphatase